MADPNEVNDLTDSEQRRTLVGDLIGGAILMITPKDRDPDFVNKGAVPKLPGAANVKDLPGGPPGIVKGIIIDNAKNIFGHRPAGGGEYVPGVLDDIDILASGAVVGIVDPNTFDTGLRATNTPITDPTERRFALSQFANWPADVQENFLRAARNNPDFRARVSSTVSGASLLASEGVPIGPRGTATLAPAAVVAGVAPGRAGGASGIVQPAAVVGGAVVAGLNTVEQFFAANPPDP